MVPNKQIRNESNLNDKNKKLKEKNKNNQTECPERWKYICGRVVNYIYTACGDAGHDGLWRWAESLMWDFSLDSQRGRNQIRTEDHFKQPK